MTSSVVALMAVAGTARVRESHAAISKFSTPDDLAHMRWDGVTSVTQAINGLMVSDVGHVSVADPATWPMAGLVAAAHGNGSKIFVPLHSPSKEEMTRLLASPVDHSMLTKVASQATSLAVSAGYDGIMVDLEGLKPPSELGLETLVGALRDSLHQQSPQARLMVTVYAAKLLGKARNMLPYNVSRLAQLSDSIFIMGYDMTWVDAHPGAASHEAGPNAPINGLMKTVKNAIEWGAPSASLLLGLPLYGRLFTCDGRTPPALGNCSCAEHNFVNRVVDELAAAASGPGCIHGFDEPSASPFFDCAHGSNISQSPPWPGVRQQAWFEDSRSISAKLQLAVSHELAGVAWWTAHGVRSDLSPEGQRIWDSIAQFVHGD